MESVYASPTHFAYAPACSPRPCESSFRSLLSLRRSCHRGTPFAPRVLPTPTSVYGISHERALGIGPRRSTTVCRVHTGSGHLGSGSPSRATSEARRCLGQHCPTMTKSITEKRWEETRRTAVGGPLSGGLLAYNWKDNGGETSKKSGETSKKR